MLFNSLAFFIFLPTVFLFYWKVLGTNLRIQNLFVLIASYVFYGWWDWRFLILIVISSGVDYVAGIRIADGNHRKIWFGISLFINIGMLCFFKYFNFFIDSFIGAFGGMGILLHRPTLNIILPVGISFYTFQTLSYSIDIYKKQIEPTKDILVFFTFVAFFPQLVAGPIERASHLLPQFLKKRTFDLSFSISGLRIMLWGFFKKVVLSDNLAPVVDEVFNNPTGFEGFQIWLAAGLFTIQIYCDFSGYSDIAIGCGRLFGFDITTNFKTPFFSRSMREFWNRWHISLNTWFRDYVYFPMGGNRVSTFKWTWNVLVVFSISGLWHGTNWTFWCWGLFNALYQLYARFTEKLRNSLNNTLGFGHHTIQKHLLDVILVFCLFSFSLIFFRSNNIDELFLLLQNGINGTWNHLTHLPAAVRACFSLFSSASQLIMLTASLLIMLIVDLQINENDIDRMLQPKSKLTRWSYYFIIAGWTAVFGAFARPENFIYFQF